MRLAASSLLIALTFTSCELRYPQLAVRASADTARADGVATVEIIATMTHDDGTPWDHNIVMFSAREVGRLSETNLMTDDAGIAITRLSSVTPGVVTVTAFLLLGAESPQIKDTTTVTFTEL